MSENNETTKLEIYKFVLPILTVMLTALLGFQLSFVNEAITKIQQRVDELRGSVSTMAIQIITLQENAGIIRGDTRRSDDKIQQLELKNK